MTIALWNFIQSCCMQSFREASHSLEAISQQSRDAEARVHSVLERVSDPFVLSALLTCGLFSDYDGHQAADGAGFRSAG